jgi:hypothetical protein
MTITIAWLRRTKDTTELVFASDSRLRSFGAMDQAQKLFRLERGDCCLGFNGNTGIAYPLFMQVSSALDNFIRTRTRAADVIEVAVHIGNILNNLVASWDAKPAVKKEWLADTNIVFGGWSWRYQRFEIGVFVHTGKEFAFRHPKARLNHPWREDGRSLVFVGNYKEEYLDELATVLASRYGKQTNPKYFTFDYEPVEALNSLLKRTAKDIDFSDIGGGPQMVKVYSFGNTMPIVIRRSNKEHLLLGRQLFDWEKTEYPILDLTKAKPIFFYPMSEIPLPKDCIKKESLLA